jgi:hypothetical protein
VQDVGHGLAKQSAAVQESLAHMVIGPGRKVLAALLYLSLDRCDAISLARGGTPAFGLFLQRGGTLCIFLLKGRVLFGDHGRGHGARPALGVGEPNAVSRQGVEFEGVPAEENICGPTLPGEQVRRGDLSELGGEHLVSRDSAAQPQGQLSARLQLGCRAVERQGGVPVGVATELGQHPPDRLGRCGDVGGDGDERIIFPAWPRSLISAHPVTTGFLAHRPGTTAHHGLVRAAFRAASGHGLARTQETRGPQDR